MRALCKGSNIDLSIGECKEKCSMALIKPDDRIGRET